VFSAGFFYYDILCTQFNRDDAPSEFWKQIKIIIEDLIAEKISQQKISHSNSHLPAKGVTISLRCL